MNMWTGVIMVGVLLCAASSVQKVGATSPEDPAVTAAIAAAVSSRSALTAAQVRLVWLNSSADVTEDQGTGLKHTARAGVPLSTDVYGGEH